MNTKLRIISDKTDITHVYIFFTVYPTNFVPLSIEIDIWMMHIIKGIVIRGRQMGRKLGFPTANIAAGDTPGIEDGVWAVRADVGGSVYEGMANLGYSPTIDGGDSQRLLEVNLFGYDGDLYGHEIEVLMIRRIRAEKRFASLDELKEAVDNDRRTIKKILDERKEN